MSDTITRMQAVFGEALTLAERKNADYGDAWQDQGWRGNLSRVFEKAKRLRTILWRGDRVDTAVRESVRETAIDMMNTLAFFIMNHDAGVEWGHEQPFREAGNGWSYGLHGGEPTYERPEDQFPKEETVAAIHDGLADVTQTDAGGIDGLPIRVPGEELVEEPTTRGRKPSPTTRTQRPK